MPPKKKGSKKGTSNIKDVALESGDLLIKANLEIDALTRELGRSYSLIISYKKWYYFPSSNSDATSIGSNPRIRRTIHNEE